MNKLYPGISPTAAARMERIAGSYASMSQDEQLSFTQQLRGARKKGAKAKAVKGKVESDEQEAPGDTGTASSESSEIGGDT